MAAPVNPTNADLAWEMEHWQIEAISMPGWTRHFRVCMKRGMKKIIRKRKRLYSKYASVLLSSLVCGAVTRYVQSDRNMLPVLYMLCNSLFAIIVGTGSIDVLGSPGERDLLAHEAASGVRPTAEALSRMLLDVVILMPLGCVWALPLQAVTMMPIGVVPLLSLYMQTSWAISTVGYMASLLSPANGTLITSALTLISFAFLSGVLLGPNVAPASARWIFWVNPGFAAFIQMGMGNAVRLPLSLTRWNLIVLFMEAGILPDDDVAEVERWESDVSVWQLPSAISMVVWGIVFRFLAVFLFSLREVNFKASTWLRRSCLWSLLVRDRPGDDSLALSSPREHSRSGRFSMQQRSRCSTRRESSAAAPSRMINGDEGAPPFPPLTPTASPTRLREPVVQSSDAPAMDPYYCTSHCSLSAEVPELPGPVARPKWSHCSPHLQRSPTSELSIPVHRQAPVLPATCGSGSGFGGAARARVDQPHKTGSNGVFGAAARSRVRARGAGTSSSETHSVSESPAILSPSSA